MNGIFSVRHSSAYVIIAPGSLKGVIYLTSVSPDNPNAQKLATLLKTAPADLNLYVSESYDGGQVLAKALANATST